VDLVRNVTLAVAALVLAACAPASPSRRPAAPGVERDRSARVAAALARLKPWLAGYGTPYPCRQEFSSTAVA
jgi:hypothetical protein